MTNIEMVELSKNKGPSGFIQQGANLLVVDYGKIYHPDGSTIGFLFEDGLLEGYGEPLGSWSGSKAIEELTGAVFQGIDSCGLQLVLPGPDSGPIGGLKYNNSKEFHVIFGRIATPQDHKLIGRMTDDGTIYFRDPRFPEIMRKMDEHSQLATTFQGVKSNYQPWRHEFQCKLHKPDKAYWENEIMRYFLDFDRISAAQKDYVFKTMKLFALSGILHVVRKTEGTSALGNVRHGASGVTGVRTGNVTLDRDEFEREVQYFKKFGAQMAVPSQQWKPLIEVRINMVVAHEFGHQLEFCLTQAMQDRITEIYQERLSNSRREHPLPEEADTLTELLQPEQYGRRVFISGYARTSMHEYWAECVAAFAIKESRDVLKSTDPELHDLLRDVILRPENVMSTLEGKRDTMLNLQASLRIGGELTDDIFRE